MSPLYPTSAALYKTFSAHTNNAEMRQGPQASVPYSNKPRSSRFIAWSAADDVKSKASALSNEAQEEIARASSAAQAKTGQLELYSLEYYAACTFGGFVACVRQ